MNRLISDELVFSLISMIDASTVFKKELISFEFQDDFNFILFIIKVEDLKFNEIKTDIEKVVTTLNSSIPTRKGEYSWMVNFKNRTEIVKSYFGGDIDNPDSGL